MALSASVLVALSAFGACASPDTGPGSSDAPLANTLRYDGPAVQISVDRVSDGDSVRATTPDGRVEVRLLGINAPEQDDCLGDAARDELERLLDEADVVEFGPWPGGTDQFGRNLGYLVADGAVVNAALVERGLAVALSDHRFADDFDELERQAESAGRGLWSRSACGEPPGADLEITDLVADAPGNDRDNPNGESVDVVNRGDEPVDLDGWTLKDESTRHRFEFPQLILDPGARVRLRTGCGEDDLSADPIELHWCDPEPPVWNNGGDTAFLFDPNGGLASNLRHDP